jgi:hypothetical protein
VVILAILAAAASLGFIVLAIVLKQLLYFFGTVICAFITISLKQTLDVYEYQGTLYGEEKVKRKKGKKSGDEDIEDIKDENDSNEETDVASLLNKMNDLLDAAETSENDDSDMEEYAEIIAEPDEEPSDKPSDKHKKRIRLKKEKKSKKNKKRKKADGEAAESTADAEPGVESGEESEAAFEPEIAAITEPQEPDTDTPDMDNPDFAEPEEDDAENPEPADTDKSDTDNTKKKKKHRRKKSKSGKTKNTDTEEEKTPDKGKVQEEILEDELEKDLNFLKSSISEKKAKEEEEAKKLVVVKPVSDEEAESYDKKKIKHTMHKYKVKRDHRLIIIDHCDKYYIKQTPAYVWIEDKSFNILLIEEEPRHLVLPLYGISEITYLKKYPVDTDKDYLLFHKKNLLTDTFRPYLPDYTQNSVVTDLSTYKNLYGFGPGIYCTNRSANNLFDLLSVEFTVDDKVTMSNKVNIYFKECYKSGILLRDDVIDAKGYANRISKTLDDMAKSTLSNNEFKDTLSLLVRNKIITKEFSDHYMDVRNGMAHS